MRPIYTGWPGRAGVRRPAFPRGLHDTRQLLLLFLLLAALFAGITWLATHWPQDDPANPTLSPILRENVLAGSRGLPGTACLAIAADISQSMDPFAIERETAMSELLSWMHLDENHLDADEATLAVFNDQAAITQPLTPVGQLPLSAPAEPRIGNGGTFASAAVAALGQELKDANGSQCAARGLILVSDGEFRDPAGELPTVLAQAQITRVLVLSPVSAPRPDALNTPETAGIKYQSAVGAQQISLEYGRFLADLVDQDLSRRVIKR